MLAAWLATPVLAAGSAAQDGPHPSGFDLSGGATIGWRWIGVDGSRRQFEEDLNLDSGAILRALRIEGERPRGSGGLEHFLVDARGIGDPWTAYRMEARSAAVKAIATFDRSEFAGNTEDDFHPFDFVRERGRLRLESARDSSVRAGVELLYGHRDGLSVGTRSVAFDFVSGMPIRQEDETWGVAGDVGFEAFGWDLALEGGIERLRTRDARSFSAPAPSDPTETQTEDFRAHGDAVTIRSSARARRTFDEGRLAADVGVEHRVTEGDYAMHVFETGVLSLPGELFERTTDSDAEVVDRFFQVDAGVRREVTPDFAWRARVERVETREHGDVMRTILFEEPPGSPPSQLDERESLTFESRLTLVEAGIEAGLSPGVDLDLLLEAGRDHEEVLVTFDGLPQAILDDTLDRLGGRAALSIEASRATTLVLEAGYELAPTHNPSGQALLELEDERGLFASARARWRPRPGVTVTTKLQHRARDIEAFGSHYESNSLSVSGTWAASERWSADAMYTLRLYDLAADTMKLFLDPFPTQFPDRVFFRGAQNVLSGSLRWAVTPSFAPRISASAAATSGDADLSYGALLVDLPWERSKGSTIGVELDLRRFDVSGTSRANDYESAALVIYARVGW